MSKNFLIKFLMLMSVLAVLVFWLLSLINPNMFGDFKFAYAVAIVCGMFGLCFLLCGLFYKTNALTKKIYIILAIGFLVATVFAVFASFGIDDKFLLPIILIVVVGGFVFSLLATGGKSWDQGDN